MNEIRVSSTKSHIRAFDPTKDLESVANIIETCFNTYLDDDGHRFLRHLRTLSKNKTLQNKVQMFLRLPMQGFVWIENGELIGNLSLMIVRATMNNSPISFAQSGYLIANVAILPDYEGRGIAKALTKHALKFIKSRGINHAFLQVRDNNPAAIHIYNDFGFSKFAHRTTWHKFPKKKSPILDSQFKIRRTSLSDWFSIRQHYVENYPRNVQWHLPIHLPLLRPGLFGELSRSVYDAEFKQWTLFEKHNPQKGLGSVAWQTSKNMTNYIWAATTPENEGLVLKNLIPFVENNVSSKKISLDYPVNRADETLLDLGFTRKQNLIWMKWNGFIK